MAFPSRGADVLSCSAPLETLQGVRRWWGEGRSPTPAPGRASPRCCCHLLLPSMSAGTRRLTEESLPAFGPLRGRTHVPACHRFLLLAPAPVSLSTVEHPNPKTSSCTPGSPRRGTVMRGYRSPGAAPHSQAGGRCQPVVATPRQHLSAQAVPCHRSLSCLRSPPAQQEMRFSFSNAHG